MRLLRFCARNGMLNHRYGRLLWRYLWRRTLTRGGRRWRTDGLLFLGRGLELEIGRMTRNGDEAEDLVQEAYLRAFRSFDTFEGQDGRAWLLAVVRNTCFSWLRKKGDQPIAEFDEQMHSAADRSPNAESSCSTKLR